MLEKHSQNVISGKDYPSKYKKISWITNIFCSSDDLNPVQDGLFWGCSRVGRDGRGGGGQKAVSRNIVILKWYYQNNWKRRKLLGKPNIETRDIHLHLDRNTLTFIKALVSSCYSLQIKWHKGRIVVKKREAA